MATLDKLEICGIRNFGPNLDQVQQLNFDTPVTLILGQNGCGKTTIIEAIKYACCGEVPGGTKNGQSFVNDPKMSGSSVTKGEVKIKFHDAKQREVAIYRVVELVTNTKKTQFSNKSNAIRIKNKDGLDESISGRQDDITKECCQLMNVPVPVLTNVIFCHQEDSLWPLDEGQKLKNKFDDIFESDKYNDCINEFRKQIKIKKEKKKLVEIQVDYKKEKKELSEKKNRELREKKQRVEQFENNIQLKNEELQVVKNRLDEILQLENDLNNLQQELTTNQAKRNGIIEEQKTIKNTLDFEYEGSDEELKKEIENFEVKQSEEDKLILDLEARKDEIEVKNRKISESILEAQTESGKLKELKKQQEKRKTEKADLFQQIKIQQNQDFEESSAALIEELENQRICLESLISENENECEKLQNDIDTKRKKSVTTDQNILNKRKDLKEFEEKLDEIHSILSNLTTSDSVLNDLKKKLANYDKTITNLRKNFLEAEEDKKIENYKNEIQKLENILESLESDFRILRQNDVLEGKIETEKKLIMNKEKEITRIKTKNSNLLRELFAGKIPEKNFKNLIVSKLQAADNLVKKLNNNLNQKQNEVTTLRVQLESQKEKVENCEKELKLKRKEITETCNGKNFNETLEQSYTKKLRLQNNKGQYSSVKIIYEEFIKKFEVEEPCCPVCETKFEKRTNVVQKIITTLKSKVNKVPQQLNKVEKDLEQEETFFNKLQQLKVINEEVEKCEKEKLPQMKQILEEIESNLKKSLNELKQIKEELKEPLRIVEISNSILSDVGSLDQNLLDVEKSKKEVAYLESNLIELPSKKSKEEVEVEIDHKKVELNELRSKIEISRKNIRNHQDRIQQIMQERKQVADEEMKLKETIQSRPHLDKQKEEFEEKLVKNNLELEQLEEQLKTENIELELAIKQKKTTSLKMKQELDEQDKKVKYFEKVLDLIKKLEKEIEIYEKDQIEMKVSTIDEKLNNLKKKESQLQETKTKIFNLITEKKELIAKSKMSFRNLENNVRLREKKNSQLELENQIAALKKRIGGYNYKTVYEERSRLKLQRESFEREMHSLEGEKRAVQEQIIELEKELQQPEMVRAHTDYLEKLYEFKILEYEIIDIFQYVTALERAVLEFHKCKMTQINKTIRHLWRNTYCGNDIDHIEIKTEFAKGTETKRCYNYKVVQVKQGVELEMRGRCSAGQKVLACLIIRMALAETLSTSCGILTLDEPTTNLDRANITKLADTLAHIITNRQREKTFQLIVITHDEDFLKSLTKVQGVNSYYKVDRDKNGFSVITKMQADAI